MEVAQPFGDHPMHLLTEKTIDIQRPAAAVFDYVTNMEKFGEWFPKVVSIESANSLPHGQLGKKYLETVSVPLRGVRKILLEVCEVQGHHFFATQGRLVPLLPRMEISLMETGSHSCQLSWRMFSRSNNPLVRYALVPLARRVMGQRASVGLAALMKVLEQHEPGCG